MSALRILQVMWTVVLASAVMSENYRDQIKVKFTDAYYNEISEAEQSEDSPTEAPCIVEERTKWDKVFTMLENSHMKEDMLLQYLDDTVKVGLQSLRAEVLELVAKSASAATVENSIHQAGAHFEEKLLQILDFVTTQCVPAKVKMLQMKDLEKEDRGQLQAISAELKLVQEKLRATAGQILPAGCDMGLLFPMRSSSTQAEITPQRGMKTSEFTVCMWIKPTEIVGKTVLFSYGSSRNPMELQLQLRGRNAVFMLGSEANSVEIGDAVTEGLWTHLCGTWDAEDGVVSVCVNGHRESFPDIATGYEISDKGLAILGQQYASEGLAQRFSFHERSDAAVAFTGKMTGVNAWDRVLGDTEIYEQARQDGQSCGSRGNLVAWGVSQITERGGVKLIY